MNVKSKVLLRGLWPEALGQFESDFHTQRKAGCKNSFSPVSLSRAGGQLFPLGGPAADVRSLSHVIRFPGGGKSLSSCAGTLRHAGGESRCHPADRM